MNPRIIKGFLKNKKLMVPSSARPITDRLKTMLFDSFENSFWVDLVILDLYSGSGSLGLEALSRGAKTLHLVDNDREAVNILQKFKDDNKLDNVIIENVAVEIYISKVKKLLSIVDLVFLDPPFDKDVSIQSIIDTIADYINKNAYIILKRESSISFSIDKNKVNLVKSLKTQSSVVDIFAIC